MYPKSIISYEKSFETYNLLDLLQSKTIKLVNMILSFFGYGVHKGLHLFFLHLASCLLSCIVLILSKMIVMALWLLLNC